MAEFVSLDGGKKSPSKKLNKKNIVLYGGLGIAAFLLVMFLAGGNRRTNVPTDEANPMNSAEVQAQLQNFGSIMDGQMEQGFNAFYQAFQMDMKEYKDELSELVKDREKMGNDEPLPNLPKRSDLFRLTFDDKKGHILTIDTDKDKVASYQEKGWKVTARPTDIKGLSGDRRADLYRLIKGDDVKDVSQSNLNNMLKQGYKIVEKPERV